MNESTIKYVDGDSLAAALTSGIHQVMGEQEMLNRINVFPVADSDTGTNLCLSLGAALDILGSSEEKHLGTMLAAMADALLDGARGNSGAIIAQFFQGLSDSAGESTRFTTYTFGKAVSLGSEYAHDALSMPREGTVLTVVAAFANSIAHQVADAKQEDFRALLRTARGELEEALANTPNQLEVLKKAGVVDAGAKGFAVLVEGMCQYLCEGTAVPMPDTSLLNAIEPAVPFAEADNASKYRFCTECLVSADDIERRKLREALAKLGDSLVLAGTKRKAKIHIHVDDPDAVFDVARKFGRLSGEKADDLHRQQHSMQATSRRFAVITDSAADIPEDAMERLDIHMVPCRIQFGDHGFLDKVSITSDEFYEELASNSVHPTTSQPAPGDFRRQFQFLASHYPDVLSLNLTSRVSGTFEGARLAIERSKAPGRIHVIDTRNASMGQGQLVTLAAECADSGLDVESTVELIQRQIPRTRTFALLDDLRYAVRGGRVPAWVKTIADLLHLKPIIATKPDGQISLAGFVFGRRNRADRFARFVARRVEKNTPLQVGIGHALCRQDAELLAEKIRSRISTVEAVDISALGPALGVHGGPGTLLVAVSPVVSLEDVTRNVD
ncbi:MAG: DegV family protein [Woeseiaceae bacterium]